MLGFLRKQASSWFIKAGLALIILVFMFFFGYTRMTRNNRSLGGNQVASLVNGVPINRLTVEYYFDQQKKQMDGSFKDKGGLPPAWVNAMRQMVLNSLINEELTAQLATSLGIVVSDEELANKIISLWPEGQFDEVRYKTGQLTYFRDERGEDFERKVRNEMLRDRLREKISAQILVPDELLRSVYQMRNTLFSLTYVQTHEGDTCALAKEISQKWQAGQTVQELLKKNSLTEETLKDVSFSDLQKRLPLGLTDKQFTQIVQLTEDKAFLAEPLSLGEQGCLSVHMKKIKASSPNDFEAAKEALKISIHESLLTDEINTLLKRFTEDSKVVSKL